MEGRADSRDARPWVLMPSAQAVHVQDTVGRWKAAEYRVALFIDAPLRIRGADFVQPAQTYPGVWNALNLLAARVTALTLPDVPLVCLFAGDDMDPDPAKTGPRIAAEYLGRFPDGGGVMQPCGDPAGPEPWGDYSLREPAAAAALLRNGGACYGGKPVPAAARICGSAWFGREWVRRAYRGRGPTDGGYWHFYADEDLAAVASRLGRMWWRPDLTQRHRHWSFGGLPKQDYHARNQTHWNADAERFRVQKAAGFPEGEWSKE